MAQLLDGAEVQREMKRCSKCKTEKPRGEFYAAARYKDGLGAWCKGCHKEWQRAKRVAMGIVRYRRVADEHGMRECSLCKTKKLTSEFYKDKNARDGLTARCKTCQKAAAIRWQRSNTEKVTDTRRCWEARNPGWWRSWIEKNPDKVAAARKRFEAKPDWRERRAVACRNWRTKNPESVIEYSHRRRARLAGVGGNHTKVEVQALYEAQEGRCANQHCRTDLSGGFHRDHVTPIAAGGSNYITNIQLLCRSCNRTKGARSMEWLLKKTEGRVS